MILTLRVLRGGNHANEINAVKCNERSYFARLHCTHVELGKVRQTHRPISLCWITQGHMKDTAVAAPADLQAGG